MQLVWSGLDSPSARSVVDRIASGVTVHDAVAGIVADGDWGVVRDVWLYSARCGAPMALAFARIADSHSDIADVLAARDTAALGARMTLRILVGLPVAGVVMSGISGLDVLGFYLGSPLGWGVVAVGSSLLWWGWRQMLRRIDAVEMPRLTTGMLAELAAVTVKSGAGASALLEALPRLAVRWDAVDELAAIRQLVDQSQRAGSPLGPSLVAEAHGRRRETRHRVNHDIEALPTRLLMPTGLYLLPAFIVLTVLPTVVLMARVALG